MAMDKNNPAKLRDSVALSFPFDMGLLAMMKGV